MPHEDTRKIIKIGEHSYGIILPRSWLRYYGLKNKDTVKVISNGSVVIKPTKLKKRRH